VVIAGGTLGILLGAALARRGWRVILIERGILRGREQEWNTSRQELQVLLELELLTPTEWEAIQVTHYPSGRIGFGEGPTWWVEGVLNVGVDPVGLLEFLKQHFLDWGGQVREQTGFLSATVHPDGIRIQTTAGQLSAQLLVDAMGHRSPIVAQARQGQPPDSVCLVVGSCAQGLPDQPTGDLFYSFTPAQNGYQPFWEAFPARDGRTTTCLLLRPGIPADPVWRGCGRTTAGCSLPTRGPSWRRSAGCASWVAFSPPTAAARCNCPGIASWQWETAAAASRP
jgi:hypothetical protein